MRLIDADALKDKLSRLPNDYWYDGIRLPQVEEIIDGMPSMSTDETPMTYMEKINKGYGLPPIKRRPSGVRVWP